MRGIVKLFSLWGVVLSLAACDSLISKLELLELIDNNRDKWEAADISDYMFTYHAPSTDCPSANPYPPVVITVTDKHVESVYLPSRGTYVSEIEKWPTIDDVFGRMLSEASVSNEVFSSDAAHPDEDPQFDGQYGYPIKYYFDRTEADCDAYQVNITEFQ